MAIESVFVANQDWFPVIESHLKTIYGNTVRFASYPSSIKPAYNTEDILKFPRGKICVKIGTRITFKNGLSDFMYEWCTQFAQNKNKFPRTRWDWSVHTLLRY